MRADDPRARRSRERLLAALREVARDGEVTIPGVSRAAGVTRATFYNHFASLEEAAWVAMLESMERLIEQDVAARHDGSVPDLVGVDSLTQVVGLLRADGELVRFADSHRTDSALPGLAGIVLGTIHRFRSEFGAPADGADAEDVYVAAGLYAVLLTGARGEQDAAGVAATAYALLPEWMRRPRPTV